MKLGEVAAIGIRAYGIILFLQVAASLIGAAWALNAEPPSGLTITKVVAVSTLPLLASIAFILFPITLAKLVVPSSSEPSPELSSNSAAIQIAGFVILGAFLIATSVPELIHNLVMIIIYRGINSELMNLDGLYASSAAYMLKLGFGIYLFIGAKSICRLVERFRQI